MWRSFFFLFRWSLSWTWNFHIFSRWRGSVPRNLSILLFISCQIIYKWSGFNYVSRSLLEIYEFVHRAFFFVASWYRWPRVLVPTILQFTFMRFSARKYKKTHTHARVDSAQLSWMDEPKPFRFMLFSRGVGNTDTCNVRSDNDVPYSHCIQCAAGHFTFSLIRIFIFFRFSIQFQRKILCELFGLLQLWIYFIACLFMAECTVFVIHEIKWQFRRLHMCHRQHHSAYYSISIAGRTHTRSAIIIAAVHMSAVWLLHWNTHLFSVFRWFRADCAVKCLFIFLCVVAFSDSNDG